MSGRFYEKPSGITGHIFEEELFGTVGPIEWDGRYIPYDKSLHMVIDNQPEGTDPTEPDKEPARDLHAQIAIALGLEDFSELKFFTAVGSPLDRYHGVDAFIKFKGVVVTFDATLDKRKKEGTDGAKADFALTEDDVNDKFVRVANEVAEYLKAVTKKGGKDEADASLLEVSA